MLLSEVVMPKKSTHEFTIAALPLIAISMFAGCESTTQRVGQSATVDFGIVRNAEQVQLNSTATQGALIGGTVGMMAGNSNNRIGTAIAGAALGTAAGAAAGGDRTGWAYTVQMSSGSTTRIVTDQREIRVGDCVAVERVGQRANIRRASAGYCESSYATAVRAVDDDVREEALKCDAAKQELSEATTQEAADLAVRKIELLCNY
jgi:hypothetical protein